MMEADEAAAIAAMRQVSTGTLLLAGTLLLDRVDLGATRPGTRVQVRIQLGA
jgi:hypothetical protein